jgi:hypothetical protein
MSNYKPDITNTPEFCRERAKALRGFARRATSQRAKAEYLDLAEGWLRLSKTVETASKLD